MFGFTKRRRRRLMQQDFPDEWLRILKNTVPYYQQLPEDQQKKLQGLINIFIDEKTFEGCGGLQITDEIKVTIAAQACILILGLKDLSSFYPGLRSILVYPRHYFARVKQHHEGGVVEEGVQSRHGEAWSHGNIVLAWDEVKQGAGDYRDGQNLVFHEFAHHLDYEYGATQPIADSDEETSFLAWARILSNEYEGFLDDLRKRQETLFDEYGAENMSEFFAVVTECFFEQPKEMKHSHSELYEQLTKFYQQDPLQYHNEQ